MKFKNLEELKVFLKESFPEASIGCDQNWEITIFTNCYLLNGDATNRLVSLEERRAEDLKKNLSLKNKIDKK